MSEESKIKCALQTIETARAVLDTACPPDCPNKCDIPVKYDFCLKCWEKWLPDALAERADAELRANAHKGDFDTWVPSPEDLKSELHHHANKYLAACDAGDLDEVAEHLGDLFNYVRKGWELMEAAKREQG